MFHRFHACVSIDTTSFSDEDHSKEKYTEYRNSRPQEIVRPRVSNFQRENFHRARVSAGALQVQGRPWTWSFSLVSPSAEASPATTANIS